MMPRVVGVPAACPMPSSWSGPAPPLPACSARPRWHAVAHRGYGGRPWPRESSSGHAVHQLAQVGARIGRKLVTRVPQIVVKPISA
jgi:hypothetical protein